MKKMPVTRTMRLGERHVEALRRDIADPGPRLLPGARPATDADFDGIVASWLKDAPADFWLFAYGSLIWNPAFEFVEERKARARGWHRAFCLGWDYRYRGKRLGQGAGIAPSASAGITATAAMPNSRG